MPVSIFGPAFTRALVAATERLSLPPAPVDAEWILVKAGLEGAGKWDPFILNENATLVPPSGPSDMRAEVAGTDGLRLSRGTGARGLFQAMPRRKKRGEGVPDLVTLYPHTDPVKQLEDGVALWIRFRGDAGFRNRASLYMANLAPARLLQPDYDGETILYSANIEDMPLNKRGNGWSKTYWPAGYASNAAPFGLDRKADGKAVDEKGRWRGEGRLRLKHLEVGLTAAHQQSRARIAAELAAVRALVASRSAMPKPSEPPPAPVQWGAGGPPDLRDPVRSEMLFGEDDEKA